MCFDSVIYKFYCFQLHFQLFSQLLLGCSHEKYVISYLAICIYMYNTYTYMRMRVYVYMCLPACVCQYTTDNCSWKKLTRQVKDL